MQRVPRGGAEFRAQAESIVYETLLCTQVGRAEELVVNESAFERRILVVDDDDMVRDFLVGHLLRALPSAHVFAANDGTTGLDAYRHEAPDLIVTDLNMHRMSGDELIEHIRKTDTTIPILVLTGAPELTQIPGATEIVPKVKLGYLVQRVIELLASTPRVETVASAHFGR